MRDLRQLPKAHLHLHFTGSMRHATLLELAERDGIQLPDSLVEEWPPQLSAADEKGWFRFQRLYDVARSVLRTEDDVRRLVREAAEDDVRDGGRWLEIQVDPSGYAARFGGITAFTDLVLDAVAEASRETGLGHGGGDRRQPHPAPARRPRRSPGWRRSTPAAAWSGSGCPTTSGAAPPRSSRRAFDIARRAGLTAGAARRGAARARTTSRRCLDHLHADRLGHGVRAAEDPACSTGSSAAGVALEVCPVSNVALGVYSDLTSVPLPELLAAGATVALGADDPLLFGSRLAGQYATMRAAHDLTDEQLAELARMSVRASRAPDDVEDRRARRDRRVAGRSRAVTQSSQPTSTGSLTSRIPNFCSTPSRTSRASASSSSVVALPRLVRASVCLVESPTRAPSRSRP